MAETGRARARTWAALAGVLALAACGSSGTAADGGNPFVRTDGGSPRADGGATDGGGTDGGGVRSDGGSGQACSVNNDCFLANTCNSATGRCQADPGGVGTDCPNGQSDCAQDGMTGCTGELPNSSAVCTRSCSTTSDCPRPYTCQEVPVQAPDGGATTIRICLPEDALGTPCRNETSGGDIDPNWECTAPGTACLPDTDTSPTGRCVPGDGCDFATQTGCTGTETCHPAGAFGFDNNRGTFCISSGSGTHRSPCPRGLSDCAKGFVCGGEQLGCLKYCTPGDNSGCAGIPGQDGGTARCVDILTDENGRPLPDAVRSISVGVCF